MNLRRWYFMLIVVSQILHIRANSNPQDIAALSSLKSNWLNAPSNWMGSDPCGSNWEGIICNGSRVISISLASIGLQCTLSGDIQWLTQLNTLDLSYNKGLTGPLPDAIGKLPALTNLILVGCSFSGKIPDSIGSLTELVFLSLNLNNFTGEIPASLGKLKNLFWLDLSDNKLNGSIPVSNGTTPGLDLLSQANHFHFGNNKLSGPIPSKLFSSNMSLIHLFLDHNQLTGEIPATLGLVKTIEVLRLDRNLLAGTVPSNLNNLKKVNQLLLSNNLLKGPLPNLTDLYFLTYLDMSNNSFDASNVPSWLSTLPSLTTLLLEKTGIRGSLPVALFSLPQLQTVILRGNHLNGTLDFGDAYSTQLVLVDLRNNSMSSIVGSANVDFQLVLIDNPICQQSPNASYCKETQESGTSYSTPKTCSSPKCNPDQISSPNCICSYPSTGTLFFQAFTFSNLRNFTYYVSLEKSLMTYFSSHHLPVDSVSLSNPKIDSSTLTIDLEIFPLGELQFNTTGISAVQTPLSNRTYLPPLTFGPYYYSANAYTTFGVDDGSGKGTSKKGSLSTSVVTAIAVGGSILFLLLALLAVAVIMTCVKGKKDNIHPKPVDAETLKRSVSVPHMTTAKRFMLDELKKCTDNFSETNYIGCGGYGKVYKGLLPNEQPVAVKRSDPESKQGRLEFKTEIELLSRVHHKNLVNLIGFCLERGELILVYEYVPNGTLQQSLSGKSRIRLDWRRRVKATLDAASGLQYLHEHADPPIIHRDIKSNNILLDEALTAKVSDFGLSKAFVANKETLSTTLVKGTMGYLDPEYFMTHISTEKSDVYSFGVMMLEIVTGKAPIEHGKNIVREVKNTLDKSKELYNLHELLDPAICFSTTLGGLEQFVDLALSCVQDSASTRPSMREVVKDLEAVMEAACLNPLSESPSSSCVFSDPSSSGSCNPYLETLYSPSQRVTI